MTEPATHTPTDAPPRTLAKDLGAAGPLAIISATLPALGGVVLLWNLDLVGHWLRSHDALGLAVYVAGFTLLAGFALLPTYAQAVLGGWAFGFAIGTPAAITGFVGASLVGYALCRRVASHDIERTLDKRPHWKAVRNEIVGGSFWKTLGMVTLLRLPLNSPFALTNLVLAGSRTPFLPYTLGTAIGMAPRTAGAVYIATEIGDALTKDALKEARPGWYIPVAIASVLAVFFVMTHFANKAIKRVGANGAATIPS